MSCITKQLSGPRFCYKDDIGFAEVNAPKRAHASNEKKQRDYSTVFIPCWLQTSSKVRTLTHLDIQEAFLITTELRDPIGIVKHASMVCSKHG